MNPLEQLDGSRFCRICFVQDEMEFFSEIIDTTSQMELLSIANIEIFEGDGPNLICKRCKCILTNAYKFKKACKRSENLLKMYPTTGTIPSKINIIQESLPEFTKKDEKPKMKYLSQSTETEEQKKAECNETSTQTEPIEDMSIEHMEMIIANTSDPIITNQVIAPPMSFEDDDADVDLAETKAPFKKPENIKILNKANTNMTPAKQFKKKLSNIKVEKIKNFEPKILNSQIQISKINEITLFENDEENPEAEIQIIYGNEDDSQIEREESEEEESRKIKLDRSEDGVVYTCSVCDRSFPLLQQLEIHKENHERARNHPCDFCDNAFFTKYDLAKHLLTHTKEKNYTCVACKKSFSRSTLLYRHEKIHHTNPDIPKYQCDHCDRCYLNKLDYDKHQTSHAKNRPFACAYCNKRFAFKQGLERHEVVHDIDSMLHSCLYCPDRFKSAAMLQRHLSASHVGKRPFPCSKCCKRFMLSHHLYRHMRTSHHDNEEQIVLQCPVCEQNFSQRDPFFEHCIEHALDTQVCPMCKFASESTEEIADHIDLHSKSSMYFCDYCASIYMSEAELNKHFYESHPNELCSVGEEEFEFVIENAPKTAPLAKKRKEKPSPEIASKKVNNDFEGLSFVEYEEIIETAKPEIKRQKKNQATIKEEEAPQISSVSTATSSRIKMSQSEVDRLKKEGKIFAQDGVLIMKK